MTRAETAADIFDRHGVDENYQNWHSSGDDNFVAILAAVIDGEANAGATFPNLTETALWLESGWDNDNPREPVLVVDTRTGEVYSIEVVHTVKLTKAS